MDEYIQLKATEDDCVYLFNPEKGITKKICEPCGIPAVHYPADTGIEKERGALAGRLSVEGEGV